jgi:hypothetical protein
LDISDKVVLGGIECFQSFILQSDAAEEKKVDWEEKVLDLYLPLHQKSFFYRPMPFGRLCKTMADTVTNGAAQDAVKLFITVVRQ